MTVTKNQDALDNYPRVRAVRCFVVALGLFALCFASSAKANSARAGKRAFAHNYARAASLLLVEADRGSPVAQTYLGYLYQYGLGVPRDYVVAARWLHRLPSRASQRDSFC